LISSFSSCCFIPIFQCFLFFKFFFCLNLRAPFNVSFAFIFYKKNHYFFSASRESSAQRGLPDSSSSIGMIKLESDSIDDQKGVSFDL